MIKFEEREMSKKLMKLSILGMVFAFIFAFSSLAQARQINVARDTAAGHSYSTNYFGGDQAYSSVFGTNRDADQMLSQWTPQTYGLMGNYGFLAGGQSSN